MSLAPVCRRCGDRLTLPKEGARVACARCGTEALLADMAWGRQERSED